MRYKREKEVKGWKGEEEDGQQELERRRGEKRIEGKEGTGRKGKVLRYSAVRR